MGQHSPWEVEEEEKKRREAVRKETKTYRLKRECVWEGGREGEVVVAKEVVEEVG